MKTNQVLIRKMESFEVIQRTSDGMFNATMLLKQWNEYSGQKKLLDHFFENKSTKEFIQTIEKEEEILHTRNSVYVKSRASRGQNAGTWMHPLLFIDFAMWLNSSFKYHVLKFVYDHLIKYRNEAGDSYKSMCSSIATIIKPWQSKEVFPSIAKMVNYVIYNQHQRQIRNTQADEKLMEDLNKLQSEIARLIELGFITDLEGVQNFLRKEYVKRWGHPSQSLQTA